MYKKNILRLLFFIFFSFFCFAEDIVHIIEKGDTLYSISKKYIPSITKSDKYLKNIPCMDVKPIIPNNLYSLNIKKLPPISKISPAIDR